MDPTIIMWIGFFLASYSVVGNDSIQTLGTFISSNEQRPWYVLWIFAASILCFTLVYGWYNYTGDVSYGRLEKYAFIENMTWPYLLPPLVLMLLTRTGIPVSTTFMVLTFFKPAGLLDMTLKSLLGYALAFSAAILLWQLITNSLDRKFIQKPMTKRERIAWTIFQWSSTGFLWGQWLIQDFANIYVYLPRSITFVEMLSSLVIIVFMLGVIFYSKGGKIQRIVQVKTNTVDIRSATLIDFSYALVLLFFKEFSNVPMSTTWVFLGLVAGREIALRYQMELFREPEDRAAAPNAYRLGMLLNVLLLLMIGYIVYLGKAVNFTIVGILFVLGAIRSAIAYRETAAGKLNLKAAFQNIGSDLLKVSIGLAISVGLVYLMKWVTGGELG